MADFKTPPKPANKASFLSGEVALVGAGPGDPDLLTLQAYRFICNADVAIYDRLVSDDIMALLPPACERVYVGKKQALHRVPQDGINALLVDYALQGKKVLRLKGGDPFVFGRGSEEALHLAKYNISCHIVPGVTAASACTSYAGIPLTHRGIATSCRFITGHLKEDGHLDLPWESLIDHQQTLVFYMGVKSLPEITKELITHGRTASTPVALIQNGTRENQRVFTSNLNEVNELVAQHKIKPPTLIVIGEVINTLDQSQLSQPGYFVNQQLSSV